MTGSEDRSPIRVDHELDIRGEICPYTFVKTKLALEQVPAEKVLRVLLDYFPAIRNIQTGVKDLGHTVLGTEKLNELDTYIYIKKTGP